MNLTCRTGGVVQRSRIFNTYLNCSSFRKVTAIGNAQLGLNAEAEAQGIQGEQVAVIEEAFIQNQFEHDASMSNLKEAYTQGMFDRREQNLQLRGYQKDNKERFGMQM